GEKSIANLPCIRRLDEAESLDLTEAKRFHLQDDAGQIRAQNLRLGELGAREIILLRIQSNADSLCDAPAAALALVGAGLRDFLDRQPLHLAARGVSADARQARIDYVTNPRYGERCFGDVGGQYDSPAIVRLEDAHLLV